MLKRNIEDVKGYLSKKEETASNASYNDFIDSLFAYIEQLKSYKVLLNRSNENTKLKVGKNEVTIADAVYLRDSILQKINVLSAMIEHNTKRDLDIFNLVNERDKLFEEYIYITRLISESDWSTEIE